MTTVDTKLPQIQVRVVSEGPRNIFPPVCTPSDVVLAVQDLTYGSDCEAFYAIPVDVKNRPLGVEVIALGSVDSCPVDIRKAFRAAIVLGASALIAAHNHPSGNLAPSLEDKALTERLAKAGHLLGLPLLDHVIVTLGDHVSLRERNPKLFDAR